MDRRRGNSKRPASSEEVQCWSHASVPISTLSGIYGNPAAADTIGRVNRLISAWPVDDMLPAEGIDGAKTVYKKLSSGLHEIQSTAEKETKTIEEAIERIGVLIALRSAPESLPPEKRQKRLQAPSPSAPVVIVPPPASTTLSRGVSITLPSRNSVGPSPAIPFSRDPKARREALAKQLPLQEGRKVAFHPKPGDELTTETDENTWILAVVTKCINQDKNRYEVQDPEPQEDGQPGKRCNTTLRAIIPLPDPNSPPTSAAHLNAYQEFPAGSTVMALYPDTSCFYRAEVAPSAKHLPTYKLKFEDDDDQEHTVAAQWVVEWPGA